MALRFAFVLLLSVYTFSCGMALPAYPPGHEFHDIPMQRPHGAPHCPANEVYNDCGSACPATCDNPTPDQCIQQCVAGCFCQEGYVRNTRGACVQTRDCDAAAQPNMLIAFPQELTQCKENEIFLPCGSACAPTCANPSTDQICTKQCIVGCFCKPGYLKNDQGVCVAAANCGVRAEDAVPFPQVCDENEEFRSCKGCDGTCKNPNPICPRICVPGCACKKGLLRDDSGKCVETRQCSHQQQPIHTEFIMPIAPQVCSENEEFRSCKGCDGTCKNPNPICPRICVPGCACKQGHLRDESGKCIETRQCSAHQESFMMLQSHGKCPVNEVFKKCGTACPATCSNPHPGPVCTKNCVIGCFCEEGYLRNDQGTCVHASNCAAPQVNNVFLAQTSSAQGKCATDREIYTECGNRLDCLATCGTPLPFLIHGEPQVPKKCAELQCAPACACKQPYVRNSNGQCVERAQCKN